MNTTTVFLYTGDWTTDTWTHLTSLAFTSMDSLWMLEEKIPDEHDIVPWQKVTLPSGEELSIGVVFDDPEKSLALHVKASNRPVLELITRGRPCLRFHTPGGSDITLQIHE
jgi:hypothetical protein